MGNSFTLRLVDKEGGITSTDYIRLGRYVYSIDELGNTRQVCERLSYRGATLMIDPEESLEKLIRREFRKRQAAIRAYEKKIGF